MYCKCSTRSTNLTVSFHRFCPYPQQITLQLPERSRVRKLQLLAHQYLISGKIEFHIGDRLLEADSPGLSGHLRRLGWVSRTSEKRCLTDTDKAPKARNWAETGREYLNSSDRKCVFSVAKHFAMVYPNVYESGLVGCHVSMEHGAVNRKVVGSISTWHTYSSEYTCWTSTSVISK